METLEIQLAELEEAVTACGTTLYRIDGLLLYTGLGEFVEAEGGCPVWQLARHYAPYLSRDACQQLLGTGIRVVGVDAPTLDHPCHHFTGDEMILAADPACREWVLWKQRVLSAHRNRCALLESGVHLCEGLRLPHTLVGTTVTLAGISASGNSVVCYNGVNRSCGYP